MATSTKKERFIDIDGTLYPYVDAKKPLGLIITAGVMEKAAAALDALDRRIIEARGRGEPTQNLEDERGKCCHAAFAIMQAGFEYVLVQTRTSRVLQPDEDGKMVVMRYVHGAATTRFIHSVDRKLPVHGLPLELSPPTPGRTMDRHAERERAGKIRRKASTWKNRNNSAPIQIGTAFLRGGAYAVNRKLVYRTAPPPMAKKGVKK